MQSRRKAVSSDTVVSAASVRLTSNQTCARVAQFVCLPGRTGHAGGRVRLERTGDLAARFQVRHGGATFFLVTSPSELRFFLHGTTRFSVRRGLSATSAEPGTSAAEA